jgi:hypothetical protein
MQPVLLHGDRIYTVNEIPVCVGRDGQGRAVTYLIRVPTKECWPYHSLICKLGKLLNHRKDGPGVVVVCTLGGKRRERLDRDRTVSGV